MATAYHCTHMAQVGFSRFTLQNGLRVIVHHDDSTPLACINIMYDVGSRDERPERTGFAHLFEHLMFGGSVNIPSYDEPLQRVGGSNNAFTSSDITNYYITLPAQNLETGFWLESDRMLSLAFTEKSLEVQRNVVIEEFRQRYLNQPYGDAWLLMRPLAYTSHPYSWSTIGKEISHITEATMEEVKDFFFKHYTPGNAIMVVSGPVSHDEVEQLANKWFGPIERAAPPARSLPQEPQQTAPRRLEVERPVPQDAIYISFHICGRGHADYAATDLISDILGKGSSSRLYQRLVKEQRCFSEIHAFVMGERDPSLLTIMGHIAKGTDRAMAEAAIWKELDSLRQLSMDDAELEKVKNQAEAAHEFGQMNMLNRSIALAYHEMLGDAARINSELDEYRAVKVTDIQRLASAVLRPENSSTLVYISRK